MANLADETQVKKLNEEFKNKRTIELIELKKLLEIKSFRSFIWRLLEKTKMFESIWEQSAKIHFNAGQQDLGHFIWAELESADKEAVFQMMREKENIKEKSHA